MAPYKKFMGGFAMIMSSFIVPPPQRQPHNTSSKDFKGDASHFALSLNVLNS